MDSDTVEEIQKIAGSIRILYVEDDPVIRNQLHKMLSRLQFNVDAAIDAMDAIGHFSKNDYDLIITDITMPGMNGFGFIEKIREKNPLQDVVVISGHNDQANVQRYKAYNVLEYFSKPVSVSDFITRLIPIIRNIKGIV
jgi:YesN/AraC family two-component response regulator